MTASGEVVQARSPAEFFTENQHIAGFDNPGKSLYTTIRELVENSLDAAESVGVLPKIELEIEEMGQAELDALRGITGATFTRVDESLFEQPKSASKGKSKGAKAAKGGGDADAGAAADEGGEPQADESGAGGAPASSGKGGAKGKGAKGKGNGNGEGGGAGEDAVAGGGGGGGAKKAPRAQMMFYRVRCRDNGCGMPHASIPEMLGRVLSGSKYGVRQTRGKFGLGAKMALIWAKKSTGLPIRVRSAHASGAKGERADPIAGPAPPASVSHCVLDIDIQKNEPRVLEHSTALNEDAWRGAELEVIVGGQWTTYKPRIVSYFQQLAIITPCVRSRRRRRRARVTRDTLLSRPQLAIITPCMSARETPLTRVPRPRAISLTPRGASRGGDRWRAPRGWGRGRPPRRCGGF